MKAAETVAELLDEGVRMVLCARPAHRIPPRASVTHRWQMLSLGVAENPRLIADDREISQSGPSYTVLTLEAERLLIGEQEPLFWVLGYDSFLSLESWYRWQDILELANLIVLRRPGQYPDESEAIKAICRARVVADIPVTSHGSVYFVAAPMLKGSAAEIREKIQSSDAVDHLLKKAVASYISEHNLYGGAP